MSGSGPTDSSTFRLCIQLHLPTVLCHHSPRILSLPATFFTDHLPPAVGVILRGQDYCLDYRLEVCKEDFLLKKANSAKTYFGQGPITIDSMDNLGGELQRFYIGTIPVDMDEPFSDDDDEACDRINDGEARERSDDEHSLNYVPFLSGRTNITSGVIHLLRELSPEPLDSGGNIERMHIVRHALPTSEDSLAVIYKFLDRSVVIILAVPALMSASDLLNFVSPESMPRVERIRLLRDAAPNRYMALIKFDGPTSAASFIKAKNGSAFSPLEPERCHIVLVSSVEITTRAPILEPLFDESDFLEDGSSSLELSSFIEVPTCPVCLERIDGTATGIVTVICRHRFHCQCLARWGDSSCPICRFALQPAPPTTCSACGSADDVWLCLICGHAGCGRYRAGHAYSHYADTGHNFALELESHRVWDYVGDNFVHRLIQNKEDGKLVEIPGPDERDGEEENSIKTTDMHGDAEYYSSMLVAQLESQRIYFEERLSITEVDFATRLDRVTQEHQSESRRLATDLLDLDRRLHIQSKANREQRESFERRIAQLSDEKSRLLEELSAERALSRQGLQTTEMYLAMIKERDAEIVILKEQVQDLMLHFESQERLSQEMVGGTLLLAPNNTQASSKKPIRRKGPR